MSGRVDRNKYQIHIPLPPKIDPMVTMMQVEDKPDVTYSDVGGCKEQIEKLREVVETPLLQVSSPSLYVRMDAFLSCLHEIGVLCFAVFPLLSAIHTVICTSLYKAFYGKFLHMDAVSFYQ